MSNDRPVRKVHGRRIGRPLNTSRQKALDELYPHYALTGEQLACNAQLAPSSLFPKAAKVCFEIGFGNGDFLFEEISKHPDYGFLAAEPFINGMSAFLAKFKDGISYPVKLWMDDAMDIAKSLTDSSVDIIYILNPDPWPKTRHHKRRIVSQENLDQFARILKTGGQLIMTTDVDELAVWMATQAVNHPSFQWQANKTADWHTPPAGWTETRYEQKGQDAGRKQSYLIFQKKA